MQARREADAAGSTNVDLRQLRRKALARPPRPCAKGDIVTESGQVSTAGRDGEEEKLSGSETRQWLAGHHSGLEFSAQEGGHALHFLPHQGHEIQLPDLDPKCAVGVLDAAHEEESGVADDHRGGHDGRGHGDGDLVPRCAGEVVGDEGERGEGEGEAVEDAVAPDERVAAVFLGSGGDAAGCPSAGCRVIDLGDHGVILQAAADENLVRVGGVVVDHAHGGDHPGAHGRQATPLVGHGVQHRHPWPLEPRVGEAQQPACRRHHVQIGGVEGDWQPQPCLHTWLKPPHPRHHPTAALQGLE